MRWPLCGRRPRRGLAVQQFFRPSGKSCIAFRVFPGLSAHDDPAMVRAGLASGSSIFSIPLPNPQGLRRSVATALAKLNYSRRQASRVETGDCAWVYWRCCGMDDVSRVCDLSVGGLFLSTSVPRPVGVRAKLDFLVPEGQIRAEAVVQHLIPCGGVGLKFTAITDRDCPNLVALMNRIRTLAWTQRAPSFVAPFD